MPQPPAYVHIHLIFSTKVRQPLLDDPVREALHRYMVVVLQNLGCPVDLTNSAADHGPILFQLSRAVAIS